MYSIVAGQNRKGKGSHTFEEASVGVDEQIVAIAGHRKADQGVVARGRLLLQNFVTEETLARCNA
jgi:hypothetical protein